MDALADECGQCTEWSMLERCCAMKHSLWCTSALPFTGFLIYFSLNELPQSGIVSS